MLKNFAPGIPSSKTERHRREINPITISILYDNSDIEVC